MTTGSQRVGGLVSVDIRGMLQRPGDMILSFEQEPFPFLTVTTILFCVYWKGTSLQTMWLRV